MSLFNRVYKLVVGPGGSQGVEISELRLAFSINKTAGKKPNNSDIRIWNLAKNTRQLLEKPGTRCVLYAGYSEDNGPVKMFEGDVSFAWTKYESPDVITQLDLAEGIREIRDTAVSLSYGSSATSDDILRDLARQMGLSLDLASGSVSRNWRNGISFHGPARAALDRVTRASGLSWSVQAGALQIVQTGGTTTRRAISLSAQSGMVETPERQREGAQQAAQVTDQAENRTRRVNSATQGSDGWLVKSLLLPFIVPNDPVRLEARAVDGVFVAHEVRHIGDSHTGDWRTELKLVEPRVAVRLAQQQRERGTTGNRGTTPAAVSPSSSLPTPPVPPT